MPGQRYEAKDKKVQKMTRDGLMEENLRSGEQRKISARSPDVATISEDAKGQKYVPGRSEVPPDVETQKRRSPKLTADRLGGKKPEKDLSSEQPEPDSIQVSRQRIPEKEIEEQMEPAEAEAAAANSSPTYLAEQSARMQGVRERSLGRDMMQTAAEKHHRQKRQVQSYHRRKQKPTDQKEVESDPADSTGREETAEDAGVSKEKVKKERLNQEQRNKAKRSQLHEEDTSGESGKRKGRLSFDDEENGMVRGAGMGIGRKAALAAASTVTGYVHTKIHSVERENSAVEGAHKAEILGEQGGHKAINLASRRRMATSGFRNSLEKKGQEAKKSRLKFSSSENPVEAGAELAGKAAKAAAEKSAAQEAVKKNTAIRRFWQKKRYKDAYVAARQGKKTSEAAAKATRSFGEKAKKTLQSFFKKTRGLLIALGVLALLIVLLGTSLTSCTAMFQGAQNTFVSTTYPSSDEDIYAVEQAYSDLESALNEQINSYESRHVGYDEYRYQVDEISHNPYQLISYFTAKYGEFTYKQVAAELEEIFRLQYSISTEATRETVTETKTVRVGQSLGQVVTSGYCNCTICCGQWSGGPTASGVYPTPNHTIAVDASNPFVPIGTKVVMNGVEYTVEDTGAFARYGVQFDVYYGDHASASAHGHQTWEAYLADDNGNQEVEVTTTEEVNRLDITLTNHGLDAVLRQLMDENEEERYSLYNTTYGNRDYLFDTATLPTGGSGFGYEIPAEALTDQKFARMIREAEKYLGYPYVWGGASPSTSFDCSGYVCWVINNCGNGWNVGRTSADGLRAYCAYVSPQQAKPGDLVFFQNTYNTPGASHVGIYVGNGMMIHCGSPIQYTSIETSYWQSHFMAFGRIQ